MTAPAVIKMKYPSWTARPDEMSVAANCPLTGGRSKEDASFGMLASGVSRKPAWIIR